MHDASRGGDRLPWLDLSRPAATSVLTARHDLPLWLALLLASAIAVTGFLVGRISAPLVPHARSAAVTTVVAPVPLRAPMTPAAVRTAPDAPASLPPMPPPPPEAAAPEPQIAPPAPVVTPAPASIRTATAPPGAPAPAAGRPSSPRQPSAPGPARAAADERAPVPARAVPAAAAIPRGRDIQLGTFTTRSQADAAWTRVVGAYTPLGTLPRVTSEVGPSPGRPRHYRVRIAAGSEREARALCRELRRIGRGCTIE